MKKIITLIAAIMLISISAQAQLFKPKEKKAAETIYAEGAVPIENNKVVFRHKIDAKGLSSTQIMQRVNAWYGKRFVVPTILSAKLTKEEDRTLEAKIEEYIIFRNSFLVLNRARIYYYLTINCTDSSCEFIMSRINYWHDDENPDGGTRYTAEEIISDEKAIDKDKCLRKEPGRFRTKTIDLKNQLIEELSKALSQNN